MRDTIRCCISCILPCGALDVIRIVHASGRVEEISGTVSAGDIMQAYPKHVLRKPPSASLDGVEAPKAVILPPDAELQKGKIYFLVPVASSAPVKETTAARGRRRRRKKEADKAMLLLNERYLSEILSEKASSYRDKRRGRVGVWRPHLDSISEGSNEL
ncbi:hypothetical protein MUK42_22118 [Musa troglodytarum]|uniref:Uncharacterized protein n=1 Tax=Musa troglodytarum TaxID=320322 RepID=A0A9E7K815_9LILI|nr:hypothetical protein MUK42_22118 [Musa troglodytarum]